MDWLQVSNNLFYFLCSCSALWIAKSFSDIKIEVKELRQSVQNLNLNVAIVVERTAGHEKRIAKLEENR